MPVGRGGVINSPRELVSQVGLPLIGNTAVHCCLSPSHRSVTNSELLAEYFTKTRNLTCILQHLNSKKIPRTKILIQNVL